MNLATGALQQSYHSIRNCVSIALCAALFGCATTSSDEAATSNEITATDSLSVDQISTADPIVVTKIVPANDPYVIARGKVVSAAGQGEYANALIMARQLLQRVPADSTDRFLMEAFIKLISENQELAKDNAKAQQLINSLQSDVEQKDQALEKLREVMVDQ